jgi:hypothetical protein
MAMMMKRLFWVVILSTILAGTGIAETAPGADTTKLRAKPVYGLQAQAIVFILDNNHYRKITLNGGRLPGPGGIDCR